MKTFITFIFVLLSLILGWEALEPDLKKMRILKIRILCGISEIFCLMITSYLLFTLDHIKASMITLFMVAIYLVTATSDITRFFKIKAKKKQHTYNNNNNLGKALS